MMLDFSQIYFIIIFACDVIYVLNLISLRSYKIFIVDVINKVKGTSKEQLVSHHTFLSKFIKKLLF